SSWSADIQCGHGRACSTLGRLTVAERLDQRVTREQVADGLAEGAAALAMHQSYARQAREEGVVEIFLDSIARLVGRLSKEQDLGGDRAGGGRGGAAGPEGDPGGGPTGMGRSRGSGGLGPPRRGAPGARPRGGPGGPA